MENLTQQEKEQQIRLKLIDAAFDMLDSMETEVTVPDGDTERATILTQSTFRGSDRKTIKDWLLTQLL